MEEFKFTYEELKKNGWDGNPDSLEKFKEHLKWALEMGWNPKEMTLQEFGIKMAKLVVEALAADDPIEPSEPFKEGEKKEVAVEETKPETPAPEIKVEVSEMNEEEDSDDDYDDIKIETHSVSSRRKRAEEAGWDEEEMDLDEFEDYFG